MKRVIIPFCGANFEVISLSQMTELGFQNEFQKYIYCKIHHTQSSKGFSKVNKSLFSFMSFEYVFVLEAKNHIVIFHRHLEISLMKRIINLFSLP